MKRERNSIEDDCGYDFYVVPPEDTTKHRKLDTTAPAAAAAAAVEEERPPAEVYQTLQKHGFEISRVDCLFTSFSKDKSRQHNEGLNNKAILRASKTGTTASFIIKLFALKDEPSMIKEWAIGSALNSSPFFVKMTDYFRDNEYCYLVMESIAGGSLLSYIKKERSLTIGQYMKIILQVIFAMDELHSLPSTHRMAQEEEDEKITHCPGDIKLANILLVDTVDMNIKLIDYGTSAWTNEGGMTNILSFRYNPSDERAPPDLGDHEHDIMLFGRFVKALAEKGLSESERNHAVVRGLLKVLDVPTLRMATPSMTASALVFIVLKCYQKFNDSITQWSDWFVPAFLPRFYYELHHTPWNNTWEYLEQWKPLLDHPNSKSILERVFQENLQILHETKITEEEEKRERKSKLITTIWCAEKLRIDTRSLMNDLFTSILSSKPILFPDLLLIQRFGIPSAKWIEALLMFPDSLARSLEFRQVQMLYDRMCSLHWSPEELSDFIQKTPGNCWLQPLFWMLSMAFSSVTSTHRLILIIAEIKLHGLNGTRSSMISQLLSEVIFSGNELSRGISDVLLRWVVRSLVSSASLDDFRRILGDRFHTSLPLLYHSLMQANDSRRNELREPLHHLFHSVCENDPRGYLAVCSLNELVDLTRECSSALELLEMIAPSIPLDQLYSLQPILETHYEILWPAILKRILLRPKQAVPPSYTTYVTLHQIGSCLNDQIWIQSLKDVASLSPPPPTPPPSKKEETTPGNFLLPPKQPLSLEGLHAELEELLEISQELWSLRSISNDAKRKALETEYLQCLYSIACHFEFFAPESRNLRFRQVFGSCLKMGSDKCTDEMAFCYCIAIRALLLIDSDTERSTLLEDLLQLTSSADISPLQRAAILTAMIHICVKYRKELPQSLFSMATTLVSASFQVPQLRMTSHFAIGCVAMMARYFKPFVDPATSLLLSLLPFSSKLVFGLPDSILQALCFIDSSILNRSDVQSLMDHLIHQGTRCVLIYNVKSGRRWTFNDQEPAMFPLPDEIKALHTQPVEFISREMILPEWISTA